jgi:hypothetical protein
VELFSGITLVDVYAAMAYFFDNRQEIENEFQKEDDSVERCGLNRIRFMTRTGSLVWL